MKTKLNPALLCDFYKLSHGPLYPDNTSFIYSPLTPRSNKHLPLVKEVVIFGVQGFVKEWLIDYFAENFFSVDINDVIDDYVDVVRSALGVQAPEVGHLIDLHRLGYLPIEIKSLPEGMKVPIGTPVLTIENTHSDFFWLTNYLETLILSELWHPMTVASVANEYRNTVEFYSSTCDNNGHIQWQCHDFSLRGQTSIASGAKAGAAFLTSFTGTDTVPAIQYLQHYYNADIHTELIGGSVTATEHSIQCAHMPESNLEDETFEWLIDRNPTGIMSVVSDTYDFWDNVTRVLPKFKDKIMARDGKLVIRPDCYDEETQILTPQGWKFFKDLSKEDLVAQVLDDGSYEFVKPLKYVDQAYKGIMNKFNDHHGKVDLLVTPNHRMITQIRDRKNGGFKEKIVEAGRMPQSGNAETKMIRSAKALNKGRQLTDLERLNIAFQADGSYTTKTTSSVRFAFSKERKMNRLENILNTANIEFAKYKLADGRFEYSIKISSELMHKDFNWIDISDLDENWCKEFIEELSHWDSSIRNDGRFKFDTINKEVMDVVELIALSAGYGCLVSHTEDNRKEHFSDVYTANILKDNSILGKNWTNDFVEYDGRIYCVQVPTGRLVVKRNRCTMVCGNSGNPIHVLCGYPGAETEHEQKGLIELLWETFGGTVNEKGYKVLDPHIGAIYGDSITIDRADKILQLLACKGFAASNVVFGVGAFSLAYVSRDSLGWAIKATHAVVDGKEKMLFKDPKTDDGTKKSQRGRVHVCYGADGEIIYKDGLTIHGPQIKGPNLLQTVFKDGKLVNETSLTEIRDRLHGEF